MNEPQDFERKASEEDNTITRTGEDELTVEWKDGQKAVITLGPFPEDNEWASHPDKPSAYYVDGQFVFMDNPFWIGDFLCGGEEGLEIGQSIDYEGTGPE